MTLNRQKQSLKLWTQECDDLHEIIKVHRQSINKKLGRVREIRDTIGAIRDGDADGDIDDLNEEERLLLMETKSIEEEMIPVERRITIVRRKGDAISDQINRVKARVTKLETFFTKDGMTGTPSALKLRVSEALLPLAKQRQEWFEYDVRVPSREYAVTSDNFNLLTNVMTQINEYMRRCHILEHDYEMYERSVQKHPSYGRITHAKPCKKVAKYLNKMKSIKMQIHAFDRTPIKLEDLLDY